MKPASLHKIQKQFTNNRIIFFTAIGCAFVICFIWYNLLRGLGLEKEKTIAEAVHYNGNLATALEQFTIRTINEADATLQFFKREYQYSGRQIDIPSLMKEHAMDTNLFIGIRIANEKGYVIAANDTVAPVMGAFVKDRPHYTAHLRSDSDFLYISKPAVFSTYNKAAIRLSRRINKPDGSFGGIVTVLIEPSKLTAFYADADLRPNDFFSLISPDGITYARRKGERESWGENIIKSPLFRYVSVKPIGSYFSPDAIFGIPTYFSYRKLRNYPIIATVGSSEKDVLNEYYEIRDREIRTGISVTAFILLFGASLIAWLIFKKRNEKIIAERDARYRLVFENSLDAILLTRPTGEILQANPAACRIFQMTEQEIIEGGRDKLVDETDPHLPEMLEERKKHGKAAGELRLRRKDGTLFPGEYTSAMFIDSYGEPKTTMIIRDITERRRLQRELLEEQKRYQRRVTEQVINAQEREREEIGRELHDNVNQVLTTVKLYLELAVTDTAARETLLPKSIKYVMDSINEIRNLSRDLSAPTLGTKSLVDSINALLEMVQSSSGMKVAFKHTIAETELPMDQKLTIYRMVQEQLNNIIKHAKATKVLVLLSHTKQQVLLTIKDNGQGFDTKAKRNGIGINNIINRAKVFDGEVRIDAAPQQGCTLTVLMPVPAMVREFSAT